MKLLPVVLLLAAGAAVHAADGAAPVPAVTPVTATSEAADFALLRERMAEDLRGATAPPEKAAVEGWLAKQRPDGRWDDVVYKSPQRSAWPAMAHTGRIASLALAWAAPQSALKGDGRLPAAAAKALDGWFADEPKGDNWWSNDIGVPLDLGKALLLFGDALPAASRTKPLAAMRRSWLDTVGGTNTGQNLVWRGTITLQAAVMQGDAVMAEKALAGITSTFAVSAAEGIQIDGSFHQHGPQLYASGYGLGTTAYGALLASQCRGTRFAFSQAQLDSLALLLLDGQQWFMQGGYFDHGAMGRELSRPKGTEKRAGIATAAKLLALADPPRAAAYAACAARANSEPGAAELIGTKVFWCSDFLVHRRPGWYASVKWESLRTIGSELVNGENLRARHLADGLTCVRRRGDEYLDVYPLWDWRLLPGTTGALTAKQPGGAKGRGDTAFAGGISDGSARGGGTAGGVGLDFSKDGVRAHKAWFLADQEVVCLGAGIAATGKDAIATAIEQRPLHGDLQVGPVGSDELSGKLHWSGLGDFRLDGPGWILHDGTGYVVLGNQRLNGLRDHREAEWKAINAERTGPPVAQDVLTLSLDHGVAPTAATYQYVIVPDATAASLAAYAAQPAVRVVANTPDLQAVWCARQATGFASFYRAGTADFGDGLTVTVDQPCLLLARRVGQGVVLSLSDPTQQQKTLTVTTPLHLTGDGATWDAGATRTTLTVALPSGQRAGATVSGRYAVE